MEGPFASTMMIYLLLRLCTFLWSGCEFDYILMEHVKLVFLACIVALIF